MLWYHDGSDAIFMLLSRRIDMNSSQFSSDSKITQNSYFKMIILIATVVQLVWVFYFIEFYQFNGYLPLPFMNDKRDTMMDLFNTLYWSMRPDMYSAWGSIYPPLVFLLLKVSHQIFIGDIAHVGGSVGLRADNSLYGFFYTLIQFISIISIFILPLYKNINCIIRICLAIIFTFSGPVLFGLERGNLVLFVPILLALTISYPKFKEEILFAILVNLKPYFVVFQLIFLLKGQLLKFFYSILCSTIIFLSTGFLLVDNFFLLIFNLVGITKVPIKFETYNLLSMTSSMSIYKYISNYWSNEKSMMISQWDFYFDNKYVEPFILLLAYTHYVIIVFYLFGIYLVGKSFGTSRIMCLLCVLISNLSYQVGGYSLCLYLAIFPILINFQSSKLIVVLILILFLPLDWVVLVEDMPWRTYSYLSSQPIWLTPMIGLGAIIRPLCNTLLMLILTKDCFSEYKSKNKLSLIQSN